MAWEVKGVWLGVGTAIEIEEDWEPFGASQAQGQPHVIWLRREIRQTVDWEAAAKVGQTDSEAPYGRKADGTPKARPGRRPQT